MTAIQDPGLTDKVAFAALRRPSGLVGAVLLLGWAIIALTSGLWVPDPYATDALATLRPPSLAHPFGTDSLGRDVLARTLAGASSSLVVGPAATLLAMTGGAIFGGLAGYLGGLADEVIMRIADLLLAFPALIIAIVLLGLLRSDLITLVLLLALFFMPLVARTVRAAVAGAKSQEFVEAARLRGEHAPYILVAEILPNISGVLVVEATVRLSSAIVTSASLSFIGLGAQPPSPDWGLTIATEAPYLTIVWWSALAPSLALGSLVAGVALLAEALREGSTR